jgi:uncharacterized protein YutE (UPF0331/DUF86 family)
LKPRVDRDVIEARLRELSRRLDRVRARRPASIRQLAGDEDLQDIVSRNLELAIQSCIDVAAHLCGAHGVVPATAGEAFDHLARLGLIPPSLASAMRRAVGFRNLLVHEYADIDWRIVMRVIRTDTQDLSAFGRAVLERLDTLP